MYLTVSYNCLHCCIVWAIYGLLLVSSTFFFPTMKFSRRAYGMSLAMIFFTATATPICFAPLLISNALLPLLLVNQYTLVFAVYLTLIHFLFIQFGLHRCHLQVFHGIVQWILLWFFKAWIPFIFYVLLCHSCNWLSKILKHQCWFIIVVLIIFVFKHQNHVYCSH